MKIEHNHEHHEKATGNLIFVFILNITFNVIVILGGLITNSVAILADCLHDVRYYIYWFGWGAGACISEKSK